MAYLTRIIVILGFCGLLGCEASQQPVDCNSNLDCPDNQICLSGECLPSVFGTVVKKKNIIREKARKSVLLVSFKFGLL